MMMRSAPLLFEEAANADGVWTLVVGRFNVLTATFRDPSLQRLKKRIVASRR